MCAGTASDPQAPQDSSKRGQLPCSCAAPIQSAGAPRPTTPRAYDLGWCSSERHRQSQSWLSSCQDPPNCSAAAYYHMASRFACARCVAKESFCRSRHDAVQVASVSGRVTMLHSMDLFCRINTSCFQINTLGMDLGKRASAHKNVR